MSDRAAALLAQLQLEEACKAANLPFVCLIGIPDEGAITRASMGILNEDNRAMITAQFLQFMGQHGKPGIKPS